MKSFPLLKLPLLQSLVEMKGQPEALGADDCPYDEETLRLLRELFSVSEVAVAAPRAEVVEARKVGRPKGEAALAKLKSAGAEVAADELTKLQADLSELRADGKVLADIGDRIQVIKTAAALIEKLTVLEERQFNTKRIARFQQVIVSMMDDLMPAELRGEFMDRIAVYSAET